MTLQSPEHMLMEVFSSSIIYSKEILEDEEPREELLALVTKFLQQASKLNEIVTKRKEVDNLLKDVSKTTY